ncbi:MULTISPECIES: CRISPR-associated endonuclease Cas1 [unclassified Desulfovibrio]|uniref:CRISPR-associated endonuclease Cas1 n=1 Tax=unclassified Desulfovibrio TaxID=2593640 RepID=UPI000F600C4B|nr:MULTISPECIES: CRISPR-associated endonuclease Cas1 [unclassified Desulfovibrio]RRD69554.1 CRISPR-associated endonuclease Cas1 [Desulfovibrio sp. OH1209_COT-279]RRD86218.1 CRISPR-associated endonuclease Cas1 [Desulfovibrio sp. OH1186_COT-070]
MIAYIREQGAKISREGRRLIVNTPDMKHTIFVESLEQLLLFGNVQLTSSAVFLLLRENIDTVFLRADGRFMGRLATAEPANALLRKRQFALTEDSDFCLRTARCIVQGKLVNQATVMGRVKRSRDQGAAGVAAGELRLLARKVEKIESLDALRGLEGMGAALYFRHFPLAFNQDWGFVRRVRRPPTDPVNAVLSLLYTVLINRCYAAVRIVGLDPTPAALHSLSYGRHALPLDLVEEFRAMLADTLTISLFNMRMLDWDDFETPQQEQPCEAEDETANLDAVLCDPVGLMSGQEPLAEIGDLPGEQMHISPVEGGAGRRPLLLRKNAFRKVLVAFSRKMETEFFHHQAGRHMSYADALIFQARQYRRLVEGEIDAYSPLMLR